MIRTYTSQKRKYQIVPRDYGVFPGTNTLTVIVGKNGTGKSRLLQGIVTEILGQTLDPDAFEREERIGRLNPIYRSVEVAKIPRKIICVSTSPFDKFPLLRKGEASSIYSYLGLRGLPSQNLSTSYMSRIIAALIRSVANSPGKSSGVADVLHYLGYEGVLQCTFSIGLPGRVQETLMSASDVAAAVANMAHMHFPAPDSTFMLRQLRESSIEEIHRALFLLSEIKNSKRKPRLDVFITKDGIQNPSVDVSDILILVSTGVARLRDVSVRKSSSFESESFRLSEASSGEQTVVMGLLGIASQIEDGSLICIDEPEVCLHPEWQERYVHLLLDTFSNRKDCQFIVATHSPQIVAELPQANCFVMNMADGKAIEGRTLSHRSIDFQLASVFKTPGRSNEFLNRTALTLFAKISSVKMLSTEDQDVVAFLEEALETIKPDDPLRDLVEALRILRTTYGRDL